jgi:GNAT superfamily N-acetyltransferase
MRDVTVTFARTLDAGSVGHILSAANEEAPWLPRIYSAAEEIRHAGEMIDAGWVRVAKHEGQVVGFIARDDSRVHALYVLPQVQDTGVGTALVRDAQTACDVLRLWSYQANRSAKRFYELRGFVEVTRTDGSDNDAGLPDILFEWTRRTGS